MRVCAQTCTHTHVCITAVTYLDYLLNFHHLLHDPFHRHLHLQYYPDSHASAHCRVSSTAKHDSVSREPVVAAAAIVEVLYVHKHADPDSRVVLVCVEGLGLSVLKSRTQARNLDELLHFFDNLDGLLDKHLLHYFLVCSSSLQLGFGSLQPASEFVFLRIHLRRMKRSRIQRTRPSSSSCRCL